MFQSVLKVTHNGLGIGGRFNAAYTLLYAGTDC